MHSFSVSCLQFSTSVVILLFISAHDPCISLAKGLTVPVENGTSVEESALMVEKMMVPAKEQGKEMVLMLNESRRKLGNFQICALCTCCGRGAKRGYCLPTPCCYAINCNIPNRPFGFCSFTPKTCNCFGCHL